MTCAFETPNFIYYSFIAVFLLSILTAFVIFYHDKSNPTNRNAFFFILMIAAWIIVNLGQWTARNISLNLFFQRITILSATIHLFFLYFSYHLTGTKIACKKKIFFTLPLLPLIFLMFSNHNAGAVRPEDAASCYFTGGPLIFYYYLVISSYTAWSVGILARRLRETIVLYQLKSQLRVLMFAITFLTVWIIFFNEVLRLGMSRGEFAELSNFFIIGIFFFITLIAFAIIKCDLFEFNTVPTKTFTLSLWSLIFLSMFLFDISSAFTLIYAISYVGLLLIFWKI